MKKILLLLTIACTLQPAFAQMQLKGLVVSSSGRLPLQGVTVQVKNTGRSTTTDANGKFSITADSSSVLVFSHVGYTTQELTIQSAGALTIVLQPAAALMEEVTISTGYQEIPNERTTGSFSTISNKSLDRVVSTNILDKLEGLSPGLYFFKANKKNELAVRGLSTINAGTEPLIVLDNFPYEGDINDINPNDIESVTVLKDASAASIWGAKAGNGVIVITTKKAAYNQAPRVSLNTNLTIQQKPDLFYSPAFLNSSDFIDVEKFLFEKGFYNWALNSTTTRPVISPVVEILGKKQSGELSPADAATMIDNLRGYDVRNDVSRYLYQRGIKQQYALNFSGGSSFLNYRLGLGFDKGRSLAVGDEQQRKSLFTAINIRPLKNFELNIGINYTLNNNKNNSGTSLTPGSGKAAIYPYARLVDSEGNPLAVDQSYRLAYVDTAGAGQLLDWHFRPLDELHLRNFVTNEEHVLARLGVRYNFTNSLNAEVKYQWENAGEEQNNYTPVESFFARNLINAYSERSGNTIKHNLPYGGFLDQIWNGVAAWSLRGQLNYAASWSDRHQLSMVLGAEARNTNTLTQSDRTYGYDDDLTTYAQVDYLTSFHLWDGIGQGNIPSLTGFGEKTNRFLSLYANASYSLNGRYTFTASARRDASNIFGANTNNKWQPLWSAGFAWTLSSEPFYNLQWLSMVKLRSSYGYAGNVMPRSALATIRYNSNPQYVTNLTYASVFDPPNPDLRWEKTGIVNLGLDLATTKGRLKASIDYYRKNSFDLLANTAIDPTAGLGNMTKNTANLTGQGIDLDVQAILHARKLTWQPRFFLSYVTNKITRYYAISQSPFTLLTDGYAINPIPGQKPYSILSYQWAGLDPATGDPMVYLMGAPSKNYSLIGSKATIEDLVVNGTTRPPLFGNFINSFSFRGLTLTANFAYKFRYWFRREALNYSALFNQWIGNAEFTDRWQKPGDEIHTSVPSMTYPANTKRDRTYIFSSASVERGDLIRLQDLSLAYEFSNLHIKHANLKKAQLYLYACNFGLLWRANDKHIDPDYGTATPPPFSIAIGFKTTF